MNSLRKITIITEYENLYIIKNKKTEKYVFTYYGGQRHKSLFRSEKEAMKFLNKLEGDFEIIKI